jgi:signal transduction histidine kinase
MNGVDAATGLTVLALGFICRRRPAGALVLTAGLVWFLGDIAPWAVYLHRGPLVQLVLAHPHLRPRTYPAWATVIAAYLCAGVPALTASDVATLAVAVTLLMSALYGFGVASGPERRARATAVSAAATLAAALTIGTALRPTDIGAGDLVQVSYDLLVVATAAIIVVDARWGRWARAAVTGLVVDLGQSSPLRRRLARALGDPTLTVGFWLPTQQGYVDEAGQPVPVPRKPLEDATDGRVFTFLEVGGERVGVLIHDASVLADRALVADVAAAAQLAVANIGLREEVRARAAEVTASRRRLLESADVARRDMAEELRHGPEQRLDRVAQLLHGSAAGTPAGTDRQDSGGEAFGHLAAGLDRARDILHNLVIGIYPPTLTTGGLSAALPELVQLSPIPVILSVPPGRFPAIVETAGYFVCSEALANTARHANASRASIRLWQYDECLRIEIDDDGVGGARIGGGSGLQGLADRAAALGGSLSVHSPPGSGTRLTIELPCRGLRP